MRESWRLAPWLVAVALGFMGCAPQLEAPPEATLVADRASCFQQVREEPGLVFGPRQPTDGTTEGRNDAACDQALAWLDGAIAASPDDAWARTERAELLHVLARERATFERRTSERSEVSAVAEEMRLWALYLREWNRVYPDLVYFRLVQQGRPGPDEVLRVRQRMLLAEFLATNAQFAGRVEIACERGLEDGCDRELLDLLSGRLYHLGAWTVGEALASTSFASGADAPPATDVAFAAGTRLLGEEACAIWILAYEGYSAYLNRTALGTTASLQPCFGPSASAQDPGLPGETVLQWRLDAFDGGAYLALGRLFERRRSNLSNTSDVGDDAPAADRDALARDLLELDGNGATAVIAGVLFAACGDGACEAFPTLISESTSPLLNWMVWWRDDADMLGDALLEMECGTGDGPGGCDER